jgi:hypothetical protein
MAVLVSTSVQTSDGRKTIEVFLPAATTLAQAQGFLTGFAPLVDVIMGGVIVEASVSFPLTLPGGLKSSQDAGATVHRGGLFGYDNASLYKWSQYIPSLTPTLFVGDLVNVGDTDVAAYITAMESGITVSGTPVQPTNQYDDDLTTQITAVESFRK